MLDRGGDEAHIYPNSTKSTQILVKSIEWVVKNGPNWGPKFYRPADEPPFRDSWNDPSS